MAKRNVTKATETKTASSEAIAPETATVETQEAATATATKAPARAYTRGDGAEQLVIMVPRDLADRIAAYTAKLQADIPGMELTRSAIGKILLTRGSQRG